MYLRRLALGICCIATLAWADEAYVLPPVVPAGFAELLANKATTLSVFEY